jgi:hypothetical protein
MATWGTAASIILVAAAFTVDILMRRGPELADDGAFFLRYAENMAKGYFWVWNPGQAPIWGASAPLWPLIVAGPIAMGVHPLAAMVTVSIFLSVVSLTAVSLMLARKLGIAAGAAFFAFAALDAEVVYYSAAGLESPLTLTLLALGLLVLLYRVPPWLSGLLAGLTMVNKVDLIPAGLFLLAALWVRDKQLPKTQLLLAFAIALGWYGFAWAYFGHPLPNAFITKAFHQNSQPRSITWTWFGHLVLLSGVRKWFTALAIIGLLRGLVIRSPLVVFLGGLVCVDLVGYSLKYPFEPYDWYSIPAVFCLLVGAACGMQVLRDLLAHAFWKGLKRASNAVLFSAIVIVAIVALLPLAFGSEGAWSSSLKSFAAYQEFDRAQAGRWVASNTPRNFVVFTDWGNPAAYSKRTVIDGSFLNMPYQNATLIRKYRPDVLILENNPGSTIQKPVFAFYTVDYRIVKIFDRSYVHGLDYFFAVLVLDRDLSKLSPRATRQLFSN